MPWLRAAVARRSSFAAGIALVAGLLFAAPALAADRAAVMEDFAFWPPNVTVQVGDSVTWTNLDEQAPHNVHFCRRDQAGCPAEDPPDGPAGPLLAEGESWTYTFRMEGTFRYICDPHPFMTGTVTVEAPQGVETPPPDDGGGDDGDAGAGTDDSEAPGSDGDRLPDTDAVEEAGDSRSAGTLGVLLALASICFAGLVVGAARRAARD